MQSQISQPLPFIAKWLPDDLKAMNVLDYACGGGRHGKLAMERGAHVTFADIDLEGLSEFAINENVSLLQADLEDERRWPFKGRQYDVVIVTNYLYRPRLSDIFELVKPGGIILYRTFAQGNEVFGRPKNPEFLLQTNELHGVAQKNFSILHYEQGEVDTPNPAVIQRLVAQRI